jgi:hypothetical protein
MRQFRSQALTRRANNPNGKDTTMALRKQEQTQHAQLTTLDAAYKVALYAKPRNEAECLRLAQEMLTLCQGTRLEHAMVMKVKRHAGK